MGKWVRRKLTLQADAPFIIIRWNKPYGDTAKLYCRLKLAGGAFLHIMIIIFINNHLEKGPVSNALSRVKEKDLMALAKL